MLELLVDFLLGLLVEGVGDLVAGADRARLERLAADVAKRRKALDDLRPFGEQLAAVSTEVARRKLRFELAPAERKLAELFSDATFQHSLGAWLIECDPDARERASATLAKLIDDASARAGAEPAARARLTSQYFELAERAFLANPELANWRVSLQLNEVLRKQSELSKALSSARESAREQAAALVDTLHRAAPDIAREVARIISAEAKSLDEQARVAALERYRSIVLESCDIVDLANLPEGDRHIAQRRLELRRLYVPLKLCREGSSADAVADLDERRASERAFLAGRAALDEDGVRETGTVDRIPAGSLLAEGVRLVLLGDPGAGKTTLLRWLATAYLLRLKGDPGYESLPDVATLPVANLLPVLVRCRDLDADCLRGNLDDVLSQTFRKAELDEAESHVLRVALRELLRDGRALLLVDGLDEIGDARLRATFCAQVEKLRIAFPDSPIVVTSRIVGYREMGYRFGHGFIHATVAEFDRDDKDTFAQRWCALTEPPERVERALRDLIRDIHSAERIERITGNPMLLTTMALVKRKVGRLPNRRVDLYSEAVQVLLNWRSEVDEPIDQREALPQLEYIAWEMCHLGVQRLREPEILARLERLRADHPNLRDVARATPEDFLRRVEARSALLVEVGRERHEGVEVPVYEFRHLTFQEYLAALAMVHRKFPGWDRARSIAEYVGPLAGQVRRATGIREEWVVAESWREPMRLLAACCSDEDVDDVVLAVLEPGAEEDEDRSRRARAVMAALCLADEPNVSGEVAQRVIDALVVNLKVEDGSGMTVLDAAAVELAAGVWRPALERALAIRFATQPPSDHDVSAGSVLGMVRAGSGSESADELVRDALQDLASSDEPTAVAGALCLMNLAFHERVAATAEILPALLKGISRPGVVRSASLWVMGWLGGLSKNATPDWWVLDEDVSKQLVSIAESSGRGFDLNWAIAALAASVWDDAPAAVTRLSADDAVPEDFRDAALGTLASGAVASQVLATMTAAGIPRSAFFVAGFAVHQRDRVDRLLVDVFRHRLTEPLSRTERLSRTEVEAIATRRGLTIENVRARLERIAPILGIRVDWQVA